MDAGDPRGAIVAAMGLIHALAFPLVIAFLPFFYLYYRSAPGTRLRYITGAFVPVMCLAGVTSFAVEIVSDVLTDKPWWYPVSDVLFGATWVWNWNAWKKSRDDDDFWTGLGGRLKKRLTSFVTVRRRRLAFNP